MNFFAKLLDSPSAEIQILFERWRDEDPRNAVAYALIENAWARSAGLKSIAPAPQHLDRPAQGRGPGGSDQ